MKKFWFVLSIISSLVMSFCWPVQPENFIHDFKERATEFTQVRTEGILQYTLHYYPIELQAIKSFRSSNQVKSSVESLLTDAKKQYQFLLELKIPKNGPKEFLTFADGTQTNYQERLTYFSFQFRKDIKYFSKDRVWLPVESFQFERNFGLTNQGSFLFEIPKANIGDTLKISIGSKIYAAQPIEFFFSKKNLNSLPQLKRVSKWKK
jgi:hypothetical protein